MSTNLSGEPCEHTAEQLTRQLTMSVHGTHKFKAHIKLLINTFRDKNDYDGEIVRHVNITCVYI